MTAVAALLGNDWRRADENSKLNRSIIITRLDIRDTNAIITRYNVRYAGVYYCSVCMCACACVYKTRDRRILRTALARRLFPVRLFWLCWIFSAPTHQRYVSISLISQCIRNRENVFCSYEPCTVKIFSQSKLQTRCSYVSRVYVFTFSEGTYIYFWFFLWFA